MAKATTATTGILCSTLAESQKTGESLATGGVLTLSSEDLDYLEYRLYARLLQPTASNSNKQSCGSPAPSVSNIATLDERIENTTTATTEPLLCSVRMDPAAALTPRLTHSLATSRSEGRVTWTASSLPVATTISGATNHFVHETFERKVLDGWAEYVKAADYSGKGDDGRRYVGTSRHYTKDRSVPALANKAPPIKPSMAGSNTSESRRRILVPLPSSSSPFDTSLPEERRRQQDEREELSTWALYIQAADPSGSKSDGRQYSRKKQYILNTRKQKHTRTYLP